MSQDPLRYFRIEARELVDQISAGVLDLDQQPRPDLVARLLRFAHTLKGAARVVRQQEIADRVHAFEEVLVPHRSGADPLPAEQMRELLRLNDEIEDRVAALEPRSPQPPASLHFPPGMAAGGPSPSGPSRAAGGRIAPGARRTGGPGAGEATAHQGAARGDQEQSGEGPPAGRGQAHRDGNTARSASSDNTAVTTGAGQVGQGVSAGSGTESRELVDGPMTDGTGHRTDGLDTSDGTCRQAHSRPGGNGDDPPRGGQATAAGGLAAGTAAPSGSDPRTDDSALSNIGPATDTSTPSETDPDANTTTTSDTGPAANTTSTSGSGSSSRIASTSGDFVGSAPAGSAPAGSGTAGSGGSAGSGTAGSGTAGSGTAGSGTAGSGTAGSGTAGSGTAGSGTAGGGSAGVSGGQEGTGAVGSGSDPAWTVGSPRDAGQEGRSQHRNTGYSRSAATGGDRRATAVAAGKGEEVKGSPSHPESPQVARGGTASVDELLDAVGEAHARFAPLRTGGQSLDLLTRSAEALADQLRVGRTAAHTDAARVVAARLASELRALGQRITDTVEQVERELDEVRGRAERLRLVSASSIFTVLHRAVRDAADAQGKRVRFEGRGGELSLDPHVLTLASNALLHVVRNAVAHGIEADHERLAAGKAVEGNVLVQVERRGRYVAFRCTDDGRGFDLAAVRRTAEERGLLTRGGTPPDEQMLVDLVLRGGISTSPTVTEVAGRGIGLDVARDVADQLGGEVSVRTEAGRGAVIELVLPLALMSLHGLIVEAAGSVATLPLDAVRTCVRLLPEQATAAAVTGKIAHDGRAIPFLSLARALYAGTTVPEGGGPTVAVIVGHDGVTIAVGVDRLAGTSTLVVRPLPELAPAVPVIGGVSMDLDGNPRLVLDAQGLVAETVRLGGGGTAPVEPVRRLPILVVDDSLTTRMLERSILESAGYEVDLAASGEEGLELARSRRYGLYLTDVDMPGIDGFTFVAETRADPELAGVPAILVSSRASAEDRERGAAVGASGYVVKGEFNQEELLAHIRRLVPA